MRTVYDELTLGSQKRYNSLRRKTQFFSTFAGAVIEALRESGYRLSNFDKEPAYIELFEPGQRAPGQPSSRQRGNNNIELFFEQADHDQCSVLIVPYRADLPFLAKNRFVAQLGLELSRYCNDPDTLRQAVAVNSNAALGSWLGRSRLPKLYLDSPPDLKPPGTMTFELRGARLVVAVNILANLGKYRLSDFELDIGAIREDLEVYFYGLEKYMALILENFGTSVEANVTGAELELPPSLPPSGTVPLHNSQLPLDEQASDEPSVTPGDDSDGAP